MDKCPHCGLIHETTCRRIKAIEYFDDGRVKHLEFWPLEPPVLVPDWAKDMRPGAVNRPPTTGWLPPWWVVV